MSQIQKQQQRLIACNFGIDLKRKERKVSDTHKWPDNPPVSITRHIGEKAI